MSKTLIICRSEARAEKIRQYTETPAIPLMHKMAGQHWEVILCLFDPKSLNTAERDWLTNGPEEWVQPKGRLFFI